MSKPVDRYGESIRKGVLLYWGKLDQPVEVTDVESGGLPDHTEGALKGSLTPGFVTVRFKIPFGQDGKPDTVSLFKDFMVLMRRVDGPSDADRTEKVLDGALDSMKEANDAKRVRQISG